MSIFVTLHDNVSGTEHWERGHATAALVAGLNAEAPKSHAAVGAIADVVLDTPTNIMRATTLLNSYVERKHVAVEGSGGDTLTYAVAAEVLSLGVSEALTLELMEEHWNGACVPPWPSDELAAKVANAAVYAQNEPGAYAVPPAAERIAPDALAKLLAESTATSDADVECGYGRPRLANDLANSNFTPPWYVWQGYTLGENVNLLYADGGVGKTLLLLMVAVAVAAGIPLFGHATVQMPSLLVLPEDDYGAIKVRLGAICKVLGVNPDGLPLHIWCLPGGDVCLAHIQDDGTWTEGPFWQPLRECVAAFGGPIFLGIETLADIFTLDETKRAAGNTAVKKVLGGFCRDFKATVWANGHPSKAAMQDGTGYAGSTAWKAAVRNLLKMEKPDPKSNRRSFSVAKANYGGQGELDLQMIDGVLYARAEATAAEADTRTMGACVAAAIAAAEQGQPVQYQRRPPRWVYDEIEKNTGRRPTRRELLEVLDYAVKANRVRYLKGNSKRMAGYYPWDEQRAAEMAAEAKRHSGEMETIAVTANRRESSHA